MKYQDRIIRTNTLLLAGLLGLVTISGFASAQQTYPATVPAHLSHMPVSQPQAPQTPEIYVVMFRADWCAPCRIVEPRLHQALQQLSDPGIEYVNIDISGGQGDWNAHQVFDRGIVNQYNRWLGVTGFAAIIDGDTKQTLGCINMNYDAGAMRAHISNLKAQATRNQTTFDLTCPEPNNRA